MTDNRTMVEMLRAPTEGCAEAIVVPPILAEQFEPKHSLINMMTSEQFFGLEKDNPHDHVRWFNKITFTIKYKDVPNLVIKLILFSFSIVGAARRWLKKEPPRSITTWDDLVSKFINEFFPPSRTTNLRNEISNFQQKFNESFHEAWERYKDLLRACPHHGFTKLHKLDTFYNALNPADQDSLNAAAGGNLLEKSPQDALTIIENKSKVQEDECVEETYTDPDHTEYNIKVPPPPPVQKPKPLIQRIFFLHTRDSLPPHIPYPSRTLKQKQQEKDDIQIQKFWNMFKQLHLNITLAEALVLMPKYQKMLKALLSNKEKLQELANTPLNENCLAVILKKLPEKLGNPRKFLIPCGFSELKCKALADLGASINLMPLSVWKKLGLPDLIPTQMTLELANHIICTTDGIARDVFVPVGKFTFPADFVVVDYESDPRVPLILGRSFLRTARSLIDVYGEEMILRDGDERLTLNMKHDTAKIASPKVIPEFHDSKGCTFLSEELPDIDSFNDIHPHFDEDPLSGSTTYSANS
nr:reverse transcriptase domain-containing protein [Tanacetum cinerariifolium]